MSSLLAKLTAPNGFRYEQPLGLFINGELVPSSNSTTLQPLDPATEEVIATIYSASAEDVDGAVKAAKAALHSPSWKLLSGAARGALLYKLADLIEADRETFATVESWNNGKPYLVSLNEDLPETIATFRYYAAWADKIHGQTVNPSHLKLAYTLRQPIGVVAQIIPWNYPLSMAAWKLGPALACGNTVVLKPAEQTPLSALLLAQMVKRTGFPPGVVNVVNGSGAEAGSALVQHPLVDKVAFTGSTVTARQIMSLAAKTLKNITLETGGKSPLVVFSDADLEQAVKWSHAGIMANQGQICTATSRILVQRDVYAKFTALFKDTVARVSTIGNQWEDVFQGPQVSRAQLDRILEYVNTGETEGATLLTGGKACPINGKGFFMQPTVFIDVQDHMRIWQDEVFGPFVVISPFDHEAEAVARANDSIYGLGASVFTRDIERAHRVAAEIEAGMVWINSSQDSDIRVPFGGVKQSGVGRELGEAGLEAYSQIKAVHVNLGSKL